MEREDPMNVVIAGGGVRRSRRRWRCARSPRTVSASSSSLRKPTFRTGRSPAEPFDAGRVERFDLAQLAASVGASYSPGELIAVDAARRIALTSSTGAVPYDALLVACGARPEPAVAGALTFCGPADVEAVRELLAEVEAGHVRRLVFAQPWGAVWSLPIYELALLAADWVGARRIEGVEISLATTENEPLRLFGPEATRAIRELLDERGNHLAPRRASRRSRRRRASSFPGGSDSGRPRRCAGAPAGAWIDGIPQSFDGFIPVDEHGRLLGLPEIYAAGDITNFPVKQGGIAAQQADAAAETIAAEAGASLQPRPFRPVLRGLLLTGRAPRYLRRDLTGSPESAAASVEPLWWPPAKIVGRYLAPFSARSRGWPSRPRRRTPRAPSSWRPSSSARTSCSATAPPPEPAVEPPETLVGDVVTAQVLTIAPEDTLGEVAEKLRAHDLGSALVAEEGRLIGILTSRDLLRTFAARVHPSEARAREWMTAEPLTVSPEKPLRAAALLMVERGIHHLPVVEGERAVGMLGLRDTTKPALRVRHSAPGREVGASR